MIIYIYIYIIFIPNGVWRTRISSILVALIIIVFGYIRNRLETDLFLIYYIHTYVHMHVYVKHTHTHGAS